ncbi:MAG TPA: biopolymer transporter ExbD [Gemmatimonadaceae bacterium]|nr:biopolymer transporter ExbD [Gemmatimonadaceae bacterium]
MTSLRPTGVQASPNVTPMIDVMLVLLIIFMVVAPALISGSPAIPPAADNLRSHPEEETDHTLDVDADGALYLDRQPVSRDTLAQRLTRMYAPGVESRVLYLRADKRLEYARVQDVLELARSRGVAVVGMVSEARSQGHRQFD